MNANRSISKSFGIILLAFGFVMSSQSVVHGQSENWQGEWVTDFGLMNLTQNGNKVSGRYSKQGTVDGTAQGSQLEIKFSNGNASGEAKFEMADDGTSFSGTRNTRNQSRAWRGWRKDSKAESQDQADFSGVWLSTMGTLQLEQNGDQVSGKYGAQGWSTLDGTVSGRRMKVNWKRIQWSGTGWLEQSPDGKRIFGMTDGDNPTVWTGVRLEGFEHHAQPTAGEMVEGRADNGMLYFLRMPDNWQPGQETDVVVLLHGSNWTTKGMVYITAQNWPDVGKDFAILGIQGERWANWSDLDDLRFNYTYVNWMGRSTYQGYPYTDRESPYLVSKVIEELSEQYKFGRVFVGGHSQGGFLTYVLHMHFPEKLAGTFPVAGGMIIQAEPDVFEDEDLKMAQRKTPMAIVHGKQDRVVNYSTGEYIYNRLLAHDFPRVKFMNPNMGHPYDFLPIGDAIQWLDAMSTDDTAMLEKFTYQKVDAENWREVGAAIARAQEIGGGQEFSRAWNAREEAAEKEAQKHLKAIESNLDSRWVDPFLEWQENFAGTKAAEAPIAAFNKLREEHEPEADRLMTEARKAFRSGNRNGGYANYQEIVDKYYASTRYRTTKNTLDNRN